MMNVSEIGSSPSKKSTPTAPLVSPLSETMRHRIQEQNHTHNKKESVRTIFMAARENSVPYLQAILNADGKIKFKDCPLHAKKEHTHVLEGYFESMARDIAFGTLEFDLLDLTDEEGRTALHIACLHNAVDSVRYLLAYYKAIHDIKEFRDPKKAGCCAKCCPKTYNMDEFLNGRDKYGNTPLVMASKCLMRDTDQTALLQVVHALLEYGADLSIATNAGNTVLHWAARQNLNQLVDLLLVKKTMAVDPVRICTGGKAPEDLSGGDIVEMDCHGVAIRAEVTKAFSEEVFVKPHCKWMLSPYEFHRLLSVRNKKGFTALELTGNNFFHAAVNDYMGHGNVTDNKLRLLTEHSELCLETFLDHSLQDEDTKDMRLRLTNLSPGDKEQFMNYKRHCVFFGALLGGDVGAKTVKRALEHGYASQLAPYSACLDMNTFHVAAFMGHSFIFGILLDALLPYGNQEQHPSRGKVSPDDSSANLRQTHNIFEMGIEGTFTRAVKRVQKSYSHHGHKWAHKQSKIGVVVPQCTTPIASAILESPDSKVSEAIAVEEQKRENFEEKKSENTPESAQPPIKPIHSFADAAMHMHAITSGERGGTSLSAIEKHKTVTAFVARFGENLKKSRNITSKVTEAMCTRDQLGNTPMHYAVMVANVQGKGSNEFFVEFLVQLARRFGVLDNILGVKNDLLLLPSDMVMPDSWQSFEQLVHDSPLLDKGRRRRNGEWHTDLALSLAEEHFPLFLILWKSLSFPLSDQYSNIIQCQLADRRQRGSANSYWSQFRQLEHRSNSVYMNHPGDTQNNTNIEEIAASQALKHLNLPLGMLESECLRIVLRFEPAISNSSSTAMKENKIVAAFSTFFFVVKKSTTLIDFKKDIQAAWLKEYGSPFPLSNMQLEMHASGKSRVLGPDEETLEQLGNTFPALAEANFENTKADPAIIDLKEECCVHIKAKRLSKKQGRHKIYLMLMIKESRLPYLAMEHHLICDVMLADKSVPFDIERQHIFAPFTTAQRHSLTNAVVRKVCDVENLQRRGVIQSYMAIHDRKEARRLWEVVSQCGTHESSHKAVDRRCIFCCARRCGSLITYIKSWLTSRVDHNYDTITAIKNYYGHSMGLYFAFVSFYEIWAWLLVIITVPIGVAQLLVHYNCGASNVEHALDLQMISCPAAETNITSALVSSRRGESLGDWLVLLAILVAVWATMFVEFWKRKQSELLCKWDGLRKEKEDFEVLSENDRRQVRSYIADEKFNVINGMIEKKRHPKTPLGFIARLSMGGATLGFTIIFIIALFVALETFKRSVELSNFVLAWLAEVPVSDMMKNVTSWDPSCLSCNLDPEDLEIMSANLQKELDGRDTGFLVRLFAFSQKDGAGILSIIGGTINGLAVIALNPVYWRLSLYMVRYENHRLQRDYNNSLIIKSFSLQFINTYIAIIHNIVFGTSIDVIYDQVMMLMLIKIFLGMATEQLLPWIKFLWINRPICRSKKKSGTQNAFDGKIAAFDSKFARQHFEQSHFETVLENEYMKARGDDDAIWSYLELVIMFGFVAMFSVAFPFAPLLAVLFVLIEVRLDIIKYGKFMQRVISGTTTGIGAWQTIIAFISMCAVAFNCLLLVQVSSWLKVFAYWAVQEDSSYKSMTCLLTDQIDIRFQNMKGQGCLSGECLKEEHRHAVHVCEASTLFIVLILGLLILLIATKLTMKICIKDIPRWVQKQVIRSHTQWLI